MNNPVYPPYRDGVSEVSERAVADGAVQDDLALRVEAAQVVAGGRARVHAPALHALWGDRRIQSFTKLGTFTCFTVFIHTKIVFST